MFEERDPVTESIGALAGSACVELLKAYGVELAPDDQAWQHSEERVFSAVIGFVGSTLRGTCLIAANAEVLQTSCPSGCQLKDWVGELSNQLAGRLKMKLLAHGVEVALTTPLSLSGVRLQPLPRGDFQPLAYSAASGFFVAWLEIESTEEFELGPERPNNLEIGDVLLF